MELRALITYFLIKWNDETYILLRIRFIMGLLMMLYLMMFYSAVGCFSTQAGNKSIMNLLDAFTDSILMYILGAMQAAPFKNQLFPIWALTLVSFRSSATCFTRCGTYSELKNVLKLLAVGYMNLTHGSKFLLIPFWIYWSFLVLKSFSRILARYLASKSLWHGRSSELLLEYMDADDRRSFTPDMFEPETMKGYRYLVYGESKQNRNTGHILSIKGSRSLITLDKIWQYDGPLLDSINRRGNSVKHLCLAFAFSRLLRCKVEGATLHAWSISMTRKLIFSQILSDTTEKVLANNAEKAFGILGLDLAFLNDYLHTTYPIVFWEGLLSLAFTLLQSIVRYSMIWWLAMDILRMHRDLGLHSINIDILITWIAMSSIMCMDIWEMITYLLSNWTMLLCVCKYVNGSKIFKGFIVLRTSMRSYVKHSNGCVRNLGQYVFLQSFNCSTWKWKLVQIATMGMVEGKGNVTKLSDPIELPMMVKVKVFEALCSLRSTNLDVHNLPRDVVSLRAGDQAEPYWSACLQLPTCSHVILVWHIATSLCEIKLAQDHGVDLRNLGCLHTALSIVIKWCCSSQHYLVNEKHLDGDLRTNYEVANCLSRYCAYLLVSKSDLLPDAILVPKKVFRETVWHAHEMLQNCGSLWSIYDKLLAVSQEDTVHGSQNVKLSGDVVQQGAILSKKLMNNLDEEHRWKILANVWVDLLVHIAPSSNAEAHTKYLESGGEFVTLIWALFCHCGIEKSKLWQENITTTNNFPGSSQQNIG